MRSRPSQDDRIRQLESDLAMARITIIELASEKFEAVLYPRSDVIKQQGLHLWFRDAMEKVLDLTDVIAIEERRGRHRRAVCSLCGAEAPNFYQQGLVSPIRKGCAGIPMAVIEACSALLLRRRMSLLSIGVTSISVPIGSLSTSVNRFDRRCRTIFHRFLHIQLRRRTHRSLVQLPRDSEGGAVSVRKAKGCEWDFLPSSQLASADPAIGSVLPPTVVPSLKHAFDPLIEAKLADVVHRLRASQVAGLAILWGDVQSISESANSDLDKHVAVALHKRFLVFPLPLWF